MSLDVWEIDEAGLRRHPDYATELERRNPLGVVGRVDWGGGARQGLTLVLNGHVDVVPPGDAARWTTPPFRMDVRDGRAYGRGVLDMKGPLVAGLAGAKAVLDSGVALDGSLLVHSVIGEEGRWTWYAGDGASRPHGGRRHRAGADRSPGGDRPGRCAQLPALRTGQGRARGAAPRGRERAGKAHACLRASDGVRTGTQRRRARSALRRQSGAPCDLRRDRARR